MCVCVCVFVCVCVRLLATKVKPSFVEHLRFIVGSIDLPSYID